MADIHPNKRSRSETKSSRRKQKSDVHIFPDDRVTVSVNDVPDWLRQTSGIFSKGIVACLDVPKTMTNFEFDIVNATFNQFVDQLKLCEFWKVQRLPVHLLRAMFGLFSPENAMKYSHVFIQRETIEQFVETWPEMQPFEDFGFDGDHNYLVYMLTHDSVEMFDAYIKEYGTCMEDIYGILWDYDDLHPIEILKKCAYNGYSWNMCKQDYDDFFEVADLPQEYVAIMKQIIEIDSK
jgi:hypothetical protein